MRTFLFLLGAICVSCGNQRSVVADSRTILRAQVAYQYKTKCGCFLAGVALGSLQLSPTVMFDGSDIMGKVNDYRTGDPIQDAAVYLVDVLGGDTADTLNIVRQLETTSKAGHFRVSLDSIRKEPSTSVHGLVVHYSGYEAVLFPMGPRSRENDR